MRIVRIFSLAFACILFTATTVLRADYKGAIVMDAATGEVLYAENADNISPPASVTKLMTFLLVQEAIAAGKISLATPVAITAEDARIGGTQVWLDTRETFPVEELLHALIIQSANDAASALARASAGSRAAFVAQMNARAAALGMSHTTFRTPHGLPPTNRVIAEGDLTSPRDLALLSRELLLHTDVVKYTAIKVRDFGTGVRPAPVVMRNHNKLLGTVDGVDGLKTGFTNAAGFCLAATAQRGGKRLIVVVMGSPASKTRDARVTELINTWFPKLPATSVFTGPPVAVNPISSSSPLSHPSSSSSANATSTSETPAVFFKVPGKK